MLRPWQQALLGILALPLTPHASSGILERRGAGQLPTAFFR